MITARDSLLIATFVLLAGCDGLRIAASQAGLSDRDAALVAGGAKAAGAKVLPIGPTEEKAYGGAITVMAVQRYAGICEQSDLVTYVNTLGQVVAAASTRPDLDWTFIVMASDDLQGMAAPGGYVMLTSGLIRRMRSEAELAAVLAHEVAHVCRKHSLGIIQNQKAAAAMTEAAAEAWKAEFAKVMDGHIADFLAKGLPRNLEYEADADAVAMLKKLGYRADALSVMLARIQADTVYASSAQQKTHPPMAERIQRLKPLEGPAGTGAELSERFARGTASLAVK